MDSNIFLEREISKMPLMTSNFKQSCNYRTLSSTLLSEKILLMFSEDSERTGWILVSRVALD